MDVPVRTRQFVRRGRSLAARLISNCAEKMHKPARGEVRTGLCLLGIFTQLRRYLGQECPTYQCQSEVADTYLLGESTFFSSVFLMVPSASRTTFSSDFFTVPSSFTSTFFSSLIVSSQPVRTGMPIDSAMNMASRFLNFMSCSLVNADSAVGPSKRRAKTGGRCCGQNWRAPQ